MRCQFLQFYNTTNDRRRPVEQLDRQTLKVIHEYPSIAVASKAVGNGGNISQVCNGKRPVSGGFKWRFKG